MVYSQERARVLMVRQDYLNANPDAFDGNTTERLDYLALLEAIKPTYIFKSMAGLILSNASVQLNHNAKTARAKIEQSVKRRAWFERLEEIFLEYMPSTANIKDKSSTMLYMNRLKCRTTYNLVYSLFYVDGLSKKVITPNVRLFLQ